VPRRSVGGSYSVPDGAGNRSSRAFPPRRRLARVRSLSEGAMVVFRALGWLLLALTVAAAVQNGLTWWSEGGFHVLALGDLWAHVHYASLAAIQTYLTDHFSSRGWTWLVLPLLRLPAVPLLLVLGLFSLWIGQPAGEGRRGGFGVGGVAGFAGGARRPRRRRSRGRL
jgi:hypothetical protein